MNDLSVFAQPLLPLAYMLFVIYTSEEHKTSDSILPQLDHQPTSMLGPLLEQYHFNNTVLS